MPSSRPGSPADHDGSFPAHERAAEEVRHRRLELGWTQDHLAERAGLSAATVRKVEAAAQPHYRDLTCTRLCAALGWAPDALDALSTRPRRSDLEQRQLLTTTSPSSPTSPSAASAASAASAPSTRGPQRTPAPRGDSEAGAPSDAEIAALNGRIARLDARQWERLMAFVDGLTAIDH